MKRLLWMSALLLAGCSASAATMPKHNAQPAPQKKIAMSVLVKRLSTICDAIPAGRYQLNTLAVDPQETQPYFTCRGQGGQYVSIDLTPELLKP